MKILQLNLIAFGHFTGENLDFPGSDDGIQLIYGSNEAGKSTALRALRALLYGIDSRSPDNFLHDYDKLRVGGRVRHSDGSEIEFIRRKGAKNTFLGSDGKASDETPLRRCLGTVDEKLFSTLFGINHEQLVAGGQSILRGGGDVGQSLFAAGLGGVSLHDILENLDSEADKLFRPQGQNQAINRGCREYTETKKEIAEMSQSSREYDDRVTTLAGTKLERASILANLQRLRSETSRLERIARALPLIANRRTLVAEMEQLKDVIVLPESFPEERARLIAQLESATGTEKRSTQKLAELETKIGALQIPENLLKNAESVVELHQRLGSHRKAAKDLPGLQGELKALEREAQRLLTELQPKISLDQAGSLRLNRLKRAKVQHLGNQRQAIVDQLAGAKRAGDRLSEELDASQRELQQLGELADVSELRSVMRNAQKKGDLEEELVSARADVKEAEEKIARDLKRLGLWSASLGELEAFPAPSEETIGRFEKQWAESQNENTNFSSRLGEAKNEIGRCDMAIEELLLSGSVPSESDLQQARANRDSGWQLVRRAWLQREEHADEVQAFAGEVPLDAAYAKSVQNADELADRLRREADRVAKKAQLVSSQKQHATAADGISEEIERIQAGFEKIEEEWRALWRPITPLPPREMRVWLQKQTRLVEQAAGLRLRTVAVAEIENRIAEHCATLTDTLGSLGEKQFENSLTKLLEHAQRAVERIEQAAQKRRQLDRDIGNLQSKLTTGSADLQQAQKALDSWQGEWEEAMCDFGLAATAAPSEANEFITGCAELIKMLDDSEKLRGRIASIRADADAFTKDVAETVKPLAPELAEQSPEQAVAEIHERLSKANQDTATLKALEKQRTDFATEFEQAQIVNTAATLRLEAMCRQAGCSRYEEIEVLEEKSKEVRVKRSKLENLNERLLADGGGASLEEFVHQCDGMDADALRAQIDENSREITAGEDQRSVIENQIGSEETLLKAMDGNSRAAEAAQKLQGVITQIDEHTERFIRLRLASAILRRETERYRSENQDPLLRRAGEFFREFTRGSFTAVTTDFDGSDNPILKGVRPMGEHVPVEGMSDGTRDQLFLALQLASVEKFISSCEPIPFIVDDVLIAFDQDREAAVLRVLAELSKNTQVIMFTHHSHLVELARRTIDGRVLHVHELEVPQSSARRSSAV